MTRHSFEEIRVRLEEIARDVRSEDVALDDALALYEEAVKYASEAATLLDEIDSEDVSNYLHEHPLSNVDANNSAEDAVVPYAVSNTSTDE